MKLNADMLFAHPVLSATSNDFKDSLFDADFTVKVGDSDNLDIVASIALKCPDLEKLVNDGSAGSGFYLICPQTYENRLIEMAPGSKLHRYRAADFFGTIRLRPVIWSKTAQVGWQSNYLHPEYGGAADFPAAAILAVGEEQRFSVDRERLKPFESIFSLAALDGLPAGQIAVDTEPAKITIKVHSQTKESIEGLRNSPSGRNVLLNSVYLPALMQVLSEVSRDRGAAENRSWFRIFEAKCAAANIDLGNPDFLRDAQRLLGLPFLKIEAEKERLFS